MTTMLTYVAAAVIVLAIAMLASALRLRSVDRRRRYLDDLTTRVYPRSPAGAVAVGVFASDWDDGFEAGRRDREELEEAERQQRTLANDIHSARKWRWLPWSRYRRCTIRAMRARIDILRRNLEAERLRANAYKSIAVQHLEQSDVDAIEWGRTTYWGLKDTDPTPADDPVVHLPTCESDPFDNGHPDANDDPVGGWGTFGGDT